MQDRLPEGCFGVWLTGSNAVDIPPVMDLMPLSGDGRISHAMVKGARNVLGGRDGGS